LGRKWLESVYGWIPTIQGAYETVDILSAELLAGMVKTGSVRIIESRNLSYTSLKNNRFSTSGTSNCIGRAFYQFKIQNPDLVTMRSLGITNPAAIIWEATPWSFVFDWSLGFGRYLNSLQFDLGLTDVWIQASNTWIYSAEFSQVQKHNIGYTLTAPGRAVLNGKRSIRSSPTQNVVYAWEGFKNPFSYTDGELALARLASAVALLNQSRK
jgi:hypothetical protein